VLATVHCTVRATVASTPSENPCDAFWSLVGRLLDEPGRSLKRPIRVFHLIKGLGRGGAEMLLSESLRFADRRVFEYSYGYLLPWASALVPTLAAQGVSVTCLQAGSNLRILLSGRRLSALLQRERIDILHCHLPLAGVVGRIASRLSGIPAVYSEHNKQERYHPITRVLNRVTWNWQARAIAVSADVSRSIRSHIHSTIPVDVVLNGVDTDRFHRRGVDAESVRRTLGIPQDAPVVGSVAVFREQKRLRDWVEAARLIRRRNPRVRFIVVGDGPLMREVGVAVQDAGLETILHLPGLQEDVRPFLAAMDVYMMSSIFEGLPVALLEAMSMECVPVCTSVGGIPEVVRDGVNGLLAPPELPGVLAERVSGLLEDPLHLRGLGAVARSTVTERFSMRRMTSELERIYLEVLGR